MIRQSKTVIQEFKDQLKKKFNIKDMGEATDYLGIEIVRNRAAGTLKIHQSKYCKSLLKKYSIDECNFVNMPILNNIVLLVNGLDKGSLDKEGHTARSSICSVAMQSIPCQTYTKAHRHYKESSSIS